MFQNNPQPMQNNSQIPIANNPMELMGKFQEFVKQMQGKNPEAMVQELLQSGKMSQAQYQQLSQQVNQFMQIAKTFGIK